MHELAQAHAIPIAPVLKADTYRRLFVPVHFLVLDWVSGVACDSNVKLTTNELTNLGRLFGRLHSVTWQCQEEFSRHRRDRKRIMVRDRPSRNWDETIRSLARIDRDAGETTVHDCIDAMREEFARFKVSGVQSLTHGDPHGNNILVERGQFHLIDTDQMQFDYAPFEFFRCLLANYCEADSARPLAFIDGYRETIDDSVWRMVEDRPRFVAAVACLELGWNKMRRASRLQGRRREIAIREAGQLWNCFRVMATDLSLRSDDLASVVTICHDASYVAH